MLDDLDVALTWEATTPPVIEADTDRCLIVRSTGGPGPGTATQTTIAEITTQHRLIPRTVEVEVDAEVKTARITALFAREVVFTGSAAANGTYAEVDANTFDCPQTNYTLTLVKDKWRVSDCFGGVVLQAVGTGYAVPWRVETWKEFDPAAAKGKGKLVKRKAVQATRLRKTPADPPFTIHYALKEDPATDGGKDAKGEKDAKKKKKSKKKKDAKKSKVSKDSYDTSTTETPASDPAGASSPAGATRTGATSVSPSLSSTTAPTSTAEKTSSASVPGSSRGSYSSSVADDAELGAGRDAATARTPGAGNSRAVETTGDPGDYTITEPDVAGAVGANPDEEDHDDDFQEEVVEGEEEEGGGTDAEVGTRDPAPHAAAVTGGGSTLVEGDVHPPSTTRWDEGECSVKDAVVPNADTTNTAREPEPRSPQSDRAAAVVTGSMLAGGDDDSNSNSSSEGQLEGGTGTEEAAPTAVEHHPHPDGGDDVYDGEGGASGFREEPVADEEEFAADIPAMPASPQLDRAAVEAAVVPGSMAAGDDDDAHQSSGRARDADGGAAAAACARTHATAGGTSADGYARRPAGEGGTRGDPEPCSPQSDRAAAVVTGSMLAGGDDDSNSNSSSEGQLEGGTGTEEAAPTAVEHHPHPDGGDDVYDGEGGASGFREEPVADEEEEVAADIPAMPASPQLDRPAAGIAAGETHDEPGVGDDHGAREELVDNGDDAAHAPALPTSPQSDRTAVVVTGSMLAGDDGSSSRSRSADTGELEGAVDAGGASAAHGGDGHAVTSSGDVAVDVRGVAGAGPPTAASAGTAVSDPGTAVPLSQAADGRDVDAVTERTNAPLTEAQATTTPAEVADPSMDSAATTALNDVSALTSANDDARGGGGPDAVALEMATLAAPGATKPLDSKRAKSVASTAGQDTTGYDVSWDDEYSMDVDEGVGGQDTHSPAAAAGAPIASAHADDDGTTDRTTHRHQTRGAAVTDTQSDVAEEHVGSDGAVGAAFIEEEVLDDAGGGDLDVGAIGVEMEEDMDVDRGVEHAADDAGYSYSNSDSGASDAGGLAGVVHAEVLAQTVADEEDARAGIETDEDGLRVRLLEAYSTGLTVFCARKLQRWWRWAVCRRDRHHLERSECIMREALARDDVSAFAQRAMLHFTEWGALHLLGSALVQHEDHCYRDIVATALRERAHLDGVEALHRAVLSEEPAARQEIVDAHETTIAELHRTAATETLHVAQGAVARDEDAARGMVAHKEEANRACMVVVAEEGEGRVVIEGAERAGRGAAADEDATARTRLAEMLTAALAGVAIEVESEADDGAAAAAATPATAGYSTDWSESARGSPVRPEGVEFTMEDAAATTDADADAAAQLAASKKIKQAWKTKRLRDTLAKESLSTMVTSYEAVKVQRNWRGYTARKEYGAVIKHRTLLRLEFWVREDIERECNMLLWRRLIPAFCAATCYRAVEFTWAGRLRWRGQRGRGGYGSSDDEDAGADADGDYGFDPPRPPQTDALVPPVASPITPGAYETDWSDSTAATPLRPYTEVTAPTPTPACAGEGTAVGDPASAFKNADAEGNEGVEDMIPDSPNSRAELTVAVNRIKRAWRARRLRRRVKEESVAVMVQSYEVVKIQRNWRGYTARRQAGPAMRWVHLQRFELWAREDIQRDAINVEVFTHALAECCLRFPEILSLDDEGRLVWRDVDELWRMDTFSEIGTTPKYDADYVLEPEPDPEAEAAARLQRLIDLLSEEECAAREVTVQSEARGFSFVDTTWQRDVRALIARHNRAVNAKYKVLIQATEAEERSARTETLRDETAHLAHIQQLAIFERHVAKRRGIENAQRRRACTREVDARVQITLDEMVSWAVMSSEIDNAIPRLAEIIRQEYWARLHLDEQSARKAIRREQARTFDTAQASFISEMQATAEDRWQARGRAAQLRITRGARGKQQWHVPRTAHEELGCIPQHPNKLRPTSKTKKRADKVREDMRTVARPFEAGGFSEFGLRLDRARRKAQKRDAAVTNRIPHAQPSVRWTPHQKRKRAAAAATASTFSSVTAPSYTSRSRGAREMDEEAELLLLSVALEMR